MRQAGGDNDTEYDRRPEILSVRIAPGVYQDVKIKNPVDEILSIEDFLKLLTLESEKRVLAELEKTYDDIRKCDYPILPQFRALLYMKLCKIKYLSALHRKLCADGGELAEKLGFEKREDGIVAIPSYKNLWVFTKKRMATDKIDTISGVILANLARELGLRGIRLGKNTAHDGFVIRSHDREAVYNGHYETTMYKGEVGFDIDLMVPIFGSATIGTDYDGYHLHPFLERLDKVNKEEGRTIYIDGGYASLSNFAIGNHIHRMRTVMNIPSSQRVISAEGSSENIEKWYQSMHDKDDFVVNAPIDYKLSVLLKYGRENEVGYYYRNMYVREYLADPGKYDADYHRRSAEESANNLSKNGLVDTENASNGTGLKNRDLHVKICFLAMQIVALIRAQHGRVDRLTTVTGLAC